VKPEPETIQGSSLLSLIVDNLPLLIAYIDSSQIYRYVNREYRLWLGLAASDIVGRRVKDVLGTERYAVIREKVREVLAGTLVDYEARMPLPDGRQVHYHARYIPHRSAAGSVEGFFLIVEDISQRVRTGEQLDRQASGLSDQLKNLRCLHEISTLREEKGLAGWRDYLRGITSLLQTAMRFPESACARVTVNGENFTTKDFAETAWRMESPVRVHGTQAGKVEMFYLKELPLADEGPFTTGERQLIEIVAERVGRIIEHAQAREALEATNTDLERRIEGRTAQLEAVNELLLKEIADRTRVQEELEASHSTLQAVFDSITDPLVLIGPDMDIRMLNRAAIAYYRLDSLRDTVRRLCHHAFKGLDSPCEGCEIPAAMQTGAPTTFERRGFIDPQRAEQVHIYPVISPRSQAQGVLLRINDVTEQKLLQQQLIQSEKMATLGVLSTSIAHEINNPNTFISFNLPILREYLEEVLPILDVHAETHPDLEIARMPYREFRRDVFNLLENIGHGAERISTFVAGLKDFALMKEPRQGEWVNLAEIAQRALSICRAQIKRAVRTFTVDIPQNLPPMWTDAQSLEHILINLLVNAAQAADKEDSRVELRARATDSWLGRLVIEVFDNGCGMDKETQLRIFDPFFTTKLRSEGTGLGLYVVHTLVGALRGRIEVKSAPGEGSTFWVTLPDKDRRGKTRR
jgi:PAS domain S-box-containing protein